MNNYKPDFLIIPYILIEDKRISLIEQTLYGVIYYFERMKGEQCIASNQTLAKLVKTTAPTIANALTRLEGFGYIAREFKDKANRVRTRIIPLITMEKVSPKGFNPQVKEVSPTGETGLTHRLTDKEYIQGIVTNTSDVPSQDIVDVIDKFSFNPSYRKWYGNKTQRQAIKRMIEIHSLDVVLRAVAILPKTNKMSYLPTVTTPVQLEDKWAQLAAGLEKKKVELTSKKVGIIT